MEKTSKKTVKKASVKTAPKAPKKTNLLVELNNRKKEAQKSGETNGSFSKFKRKKKRNENNSNVGPSWGRRKGN